MRLEGWENPYTGRNHGKEVDPLDYAQNKILGGVFEEGADAYEAALKQAGIRQLLQDPVLHYEEWHGRWGWVVFIEE